MCINNNYYEHTDNTIVIFGMGGLFEQSILSNVYIATNYDSHLYPHTPCMHGPIASETEHVKLSMLNV